LWTRSYISYSIASALPNKFILVYYRSGDCPVSHYPASDGCCDKKRDFVKVLYLRLVTHYRAVVSFLRTASLQVFITSNRHVAEWMVLFDDQIIANSALDRLAHNAHQMIIEGESYRKKKGTIGSKL
jgi:hypothetical protein